MKNRDGRIGYSVFGAPDGEHTVIFFPGVPGSRFSRIPDDTVLRQKGVRVIAVERPGVGLSTPLPTYSMQSYADDIGELTDALGVRQFGIVGFSGGGPFALAATARLQAKTTGLALIGSVYRYVDGAPSLNDFRTLGFSNGVYLQTHFPLFTSVMFRVLAPAVVKPEMAARMGLESMDAADKRLFERTRGLCALVASRELTYHFVISVCCFCSRGVGNAFWRNALQAEYAEMFRNGVTSFLQHGKLLLDQSTTHTFSAGASDDVVVCFLFLLTVCC